MADILDYFLRDPTKHSGCYDGIEWFVAEDGNRSTKLVQSKTFREVVPGLDVPRLMLQAMAHDLLKKHARSVSPRMRSDRVWSYVQGLKWYREGADILRPSDHWFPKDEIWAVPPPEMLGVFWGSDRNWGLATFRGAKVLRIRVEWVDRFSRI